MDYSKLVMRLPSRSFKQKVEKAAKRSKKESASLALQCSSFVPRE